MPPRGAGDARRGSSSRLAAVGMWLQIGLLVVVALQLTVLGGLPILRQWALFAAHALVFPLHMWGIDGVPTLHLFVSFLGKLLLALAPAAMLFLCAPQWRILTVLYALLVTAGSVAFARACPSPAHWIALAVCSALGVALVRHRFLRAAVALPLIVLVAVPALRHGSSWQGGAQLAARCAANDGNPAAGIDESMFVPRYYGVHVVPPDSVLLTGETPEDGKFLGLSHGGTGSWWFHERADGELALLAPSRMNGNIWTSCLLDGDRWIVRAGVLTQLRPPGPDRDEWMRRFPFEMIGFDAPDTACDQRHGRVFASDVLDGRLIELSPQTGMQPRRRADSLSVRGGPMAMRESDGRLVMLDFQEIVVYDPDAHRVIGRTPAAFASSSLTLCQSDGRVAVPDLAGRLRIFRPKADGAYEFERGIPLFAPRFARFSPDCSYLGVTSGDDEHVWIVDSATGRILHTFRRGPGLRGADFIGPRALAVADACTISVLRF